MIRNGREYRELVELIPDQDARGDVVGFYGLVQDVTDLHDARARVEESEQRLRRITDNIPSMVAYIDRDRRYRFNSRYYETWLERPLAEITGGQERLSMTGLFSDAGRSQTRFPLAPALVALALMLLLAEVFVRRFLAGRPQPLAGVTDVALKAVLETAQRRATTSRNPPASMAPHNVTAEPAAPMPDVNSALEQARERARRRTGR